MNNHEEIRNIAFSLDENLVDIHTRASKLAKQLFLSHEINDKHPVDVFLFQLRLYISDHKDIGIWSDYFDKLTDEQLCFEAEWIRLKNTPPDDTATDIIETKEAQDELKQMSEQMAKMSMDKLQRRVNTAKNKKNASSDELSFKQAEESGNRITPKQASGKTEWVDSMSEQEMNFFKTGKFGGEE